MIASTAAGDCRRYSARIPEAGRRLPGTVRSTGRLLPAASLSKSVKIYRKCIWPASGTPRALVLRLLGVPAEQGTRSRGGRESVVPVGAHEQSPWWCQWISLRPPPSLAPRASAAEKYSYARAPAGPAEFPQYLPSEGNTLGGVPLATGRDQILC